MSEVNELGQDLTANIRTYVIIICVQSYLYVSAEDERERPGYLLGYARLHPESSFALLRGSVIFMRGVPLGLTTEL